MSAGNLVDVTRQLLATFAETCDCGECGACRLGNRAAEAIEAFARQQHTIVNALRVAAGVWAADAIAMRGQLGLSRQFERWALEASGLADDIEAGGAEVHS